MTKAKLAAQLGVTPEHVGELRQRGFPNARGKLTEEHIVYICEQIKDEIKEPVEEVEEPPAPERVVITHTMPGSKFVECMSKAGRVGRHRLLLPYGSSRHFPVGRVTYASMIEFQGAKVFVHSSIVDKYWRPHETI